MEITIMRLSVNSGLNERDVYNLLQIHPFTEESGGGFKDINIEEDKTVSGRVIKRTPIFVTAFDIESQSLVEREEFILDEIEFIIDPLNKIIEIYASSRNVKKLETVFFQTVNNVLKLIHFTLKPSRILESLKEEADSCEITKLLIKDFVAEKGVIGSYDIRAIDSQIAWRLVDECRNEIVKASVNIYKENIDAHVQIFQNGKFKITTKPRNNAGLILFIIKNLISKNLQN